MKKSWKNHEESGKITKKSLNNHEKIMNKSLKILQKSLKNEEKTCFPLQPEAHFPKKDISESKEKTKAQLLTGRVPTQLWQDTFPPNSDRTRSHPLRRDDWKPRSRQRTSWASKNEKVFPAAARSTFLQNTHLNHRRIIKQYMKNQHRIVKESWKNHETIMKTS